MARFVVAGAGAVGASVAYHLALLGARDVVLVDRGSIAGGATGKALGGVRQQFSSAAEVRLARESLRFFEELGEPLFEQVGYLFLATSVDGLAVLEARRGVQVELGVPVEAIDASRASELAPGLATDDVLGGSFCASDGVTDPGAVTRELVRRAARLGVEVLEGTDEQEIAGDVRIVACGALSPDVARRHGVELPIRPLCRQLVLTGPVHDLPGRLPLVIESETGFHFRRRGRRLVLAMPERVPRWGREAVVDARLAEDWLGRLAARFPRAAGVAIEHAWAGLYDMTPDAHPIVGRAGETLYLACGFSGHGFMQAPAVGRAVAEELLEGRASIDLSPYRLERFAAGATFAETAIL